MNADLADFLMSMSIAVPATVAIVKIKTIPKTYFPLIYLLWLGLINEVASFLVFVTNNAIPTNIYYITEFFLYCWQFHNWKHIFVRKYSFILLTGAVALFWIIDEILLKKIDTFDSLFLVIYPSVLVLLAVNELNFLVANEHGNILKSAIFIFSTAMIIFYSYQALSEIFYHYAQKSEMKERIFSIQSYVNVLYNILLTLVVLWIPKKRTITLP